jgi:linoleate 10R-lipoxygenase
LQYVADTIWRINERGTWTSDLETLLKDPAKLLQQDDEIFNTARLINAVTYANVILSDYLAGILGTVR